MNRQDCTDIMEPFKNDIRRSIRLSTRPLKRYSPSIPDPTLKKFKGSPKKQNVMLISRQSHVKIEKIPSPSGSARELPTARKRCVPVGYRHEAAAKLQGKISSPSSASRKPPTGRKTCVPIASRKVCGGGVKYRDIAVAKMNAKISGANTRTSTRVKSESNKLQPAKLGKLPPPIPAHDGQSFLDICFPTQETYICSTTYNLRELFGPETFGYPFRYGTILAKRTTIDGKTDYFVQMD